MQTDLLSADASKTPTKEYPVFNDSTALACDDVHPARQLRVLPEGSIDLDAAAWAVLGAPDTKAQQLVIR
jgi:hypothetical protein